MRHTLLHDEVCSFGFGDVNVLSTLVVNETLSKN